MPVLLSRERLDDLLCANLSATFVLKTIFSGLLFAVRNAYRERLFDTEYSLLLYLWYGVSVRRLELFPLLYVFFEN